MQQQQAQQAQVPPEAGKAAGAAVVDTAVDTASLVAGPVVYTASRRLCPYLCHRHAGTTAWSSKCRKDLRTDTGHTLERYLELMSTQGVELVA